MSYPSIESLYLNILGDKSEFKDGKSIKEYVVDKKDIIIDNIVNGYILIKDILEEAINQKFSPSFLDDFKDCNLKTFEYEEKYYFKNKLYKTLSLVILSFLDLGIIEE